MPGRRAAGARWGDHVCSKFESIGVRQFPAQPYFYAKEGTRIVLESHMDDFHGVGRRSEVEPFLEQVRIMFKLKASDLILEGEYSHLKRIRWKLKDYTLITPTPKHERNVIMALNLEGAKGVATPHLSEDRPADGVPIESARVSFFRSCKMTLLYDCTNRPDLQLEVNEKSSF